MSGDNLSLVRIGEVIARSGRSRSVIYEAIKRGEMTRPIKLGARCSVWPTYELDALIKAAIAGADRAEICALVDELHSRRETIRAKSPGAN